MYKVLYDHRPHTSEIPSIKRLFGNNNGLNIVSAEEGTPEYWVNKVRNDSENDVMLKSQKFSRPLPKIVAAPKRRNHKPPTRTPMTPQALLNTPFLERPDAILYFNRGKQRTQQQKLAEVLAAHKQRGLEVDIAMNNAMWAWYNLEKEEAELEKKKMESESAAPITV